MSTEIATRTTTDLVIDPEQTRFNEVQLAALRQLGVEDAPQGDLDVFFHQSKRTGLDPFAKQIYMLGRKSKNQQTQRWETKYTIQIGIDGYRLVANRAARLAGDELSIGEPSWRGPATAWDDVWLDQDAPGAARVIVVRNGQQFIGIAMYSEFVQLKSDGKPNSMWAKMPANQLAKCAEAQALRKAYPNDLSGLVLEDAAQPIVVDGEVVRASAGIRGITALKAQATATQHNASEVPGSTSAQWTAVATLFSKHGITDRDDRLKYLNARFAREFSSAKDLTKAEASELIDELSQQLPVDVSELSEADQ